MIGQTVVHILMDEYLKNLSPLERMALAEFLRNKDQTDPLWLKRLISAHLGAHWILVALPLSGPDHATFRSLLNLRFCGVLVPPAAMASAILAVFTSTQHGSP